MMLLNGRNFKHERSQLWKCVNSLAEWQPVHLRYYAKSQWAAASRPSSARPDRDNQWERAMEGSLDCKRRAQDLVNLGLQVSALDPQVAAPSAMAPQPDGIAE
eukprot:1165101-Amphidinium_carterae.1